MNPLLVAFFGFLFTCFVVFLLFVAAFIIAEILEVLNLTRD